MDKPKRMFLSLPMHGKSEDEIKATIKAMQDWHKRAFPASHPSYIDNHDFKANSEILAFVNERIYYLGAAIQLLSTCDFAMFAPGWESANGCLIEKEVCDKYFIPYIFIPEGEL